jgi:hypothetical protein
MSEDDDAATTEAAYLLRSWLVKAARLLDSRIVDRGGEFESGPGGAKTQLSGAI